MKNVGFVVQDLIAVNSINILAGESGLGKTPFGIQMGVCVAAGIPFLNMETKQGAVVYADYENSAEDWERMAREISLSQGLPDIPENLRRLDMGTIEQVQHEVSTLKPILLLVDTLRFLDPQAERENTTAASRLLWFKHFAKYNTAVAYFHHMRKESTREDEARPFLGDPNVRVMDWMRYAAGAGALANQADMRIGFDEGSGETELLVRGHRRGAGEIGPFHLGRRKDDAGDDVCYFLRTGEQLLSQQHRSFLLLLPAGEELTFAQILARLGRTPVQTSRFLKAAVLSGLLRRKGKKNHDLTWSKVSLSQGGAGGTGGRY